MTYDIVDNRVDAGTGTPGYAVRAKGPGATVNLRGTVSPTLTNLNSAADTYGNLLDRVTGNALDITRNEAGEPVIAKFRNTNAAGFTSVEIDRPSSARYALFKHTTAGALDWVAGTPYLGTNYVVGKGINIEDAILTVKPQGVAVTGGLETTGGLTGKALDISRNEAAETTVALFRNSHANGFTRVDLDRSSSARYALMRHTTAGAVDWVAGTPYLSTNYGIGTGINATDMILSVTPTGAGYLAGTGGAVIQNTSKSTPMTLNKFSGTITMDAASLAAGAAVSFTLFCDKVAPNDTVIPNLISGSTANSYILSVTAVASGTCRFQLYNISGVALAEAVVIQYNVFKGSAN